MGRAVKGLALGLLSALTACGGGGGGGGTESTLTPYTLSVTVSGLNGGTVVLQNNGGDDLSTSANGNFTFSATLIAGVTYSITVLNHPAGQSCTVPPNGSGTITGANVANIAITCATNTVNVAVSGLNGTVKLHENNGGNDLSISADGSSAFSGPFNFGASYNVTVLTQPVAQNCTVGSGSGMVSGALSNITLTCVVVAPAAPTVAFAFGYKQFRFTWGAVGGAAFYRVHENPDGVSGYTQVSANLAVASYNHDIASLFQRLGALYLVEACNSAGCTPSSPLSVAANLSPGAGVYVKASNTGADDQFGFAVALSADGSTLAVAASGESSALTGVTAGAVSEATTGNGATSSGAVYVFTRSGATWSQQAYVKASNAGALDRFGWSVALSANGNTLAVGAEHERSALTGVTAGAISEAAAGNGALSAGAAYVFTRSGTTWSQQAYVKASNTEANDTFGFSVALSGDGNTLAVSAIAEASALTGVTAGAVSEATAGNGAPGAGAVYVFTRTGTVWSQQAYVKASNSGAGDKFGWSLALSGDGSLLAVGAPIESSVLVGVTGGVVTEATAGNGAPGAGAAYVFTRFGTAWNQHAYIKASNAEADDQFGSSVALSSDGSTLAVGAPREASAIPGVATGNPTPTDNDSAPLAGAAYVFTRPLGSWLQQAYIKASNTELGDEFGAVLALSADGNTLAVGSRESGAHAGLIAGAVDETTAGNGASFSGAVYLFKRSGVAWTQQAYVKATNPGASDLFGFPFFGSGGLALSGDASTLAAGATNEESAATGIGGNQVNTCGVNTTNCAIGSGAVYLY